MERILRVADVLDRLNIGRSTLYEMKARGDFPEPMQIGARAVGWRERVVNEWIEERDRAAARPAA